MVPRLRDSCAVVSTGNRARFTQPRDHSLTEPCKDYLASVSSVFEDHIFKLSTGLVKKAAKRLSWLAQARAASIQQN